MNEVAKLEERKAKLYRALVQLVPRDFGEDLKLLAVHAERSSKLLRKAKVQTGNIHGMEDIRTAVEFLEKALTDPNMDVEDLYRYAIDAERASARLYRELSMKAGEEKWRRLFKWLAEISEEHARILERHLEMWHFLREQTEEEEIPEDLIEQWFEDVDL